MKVIAFTNAKGGVGKTTSTANVGIEIASRGHRVLLVDLDPQADLSKACGLDTQSNTVGHALLGLEKIADCISQVHWLNDDHEREAIANLFLLPSSILLGVQEGSISQKKDFQYLLAKRLQEVADHYDYVVIDCPPALSTMTYMAFCAADAYVVPSSAEQLSFNKIPLVRKVAERVQQSGENPRLKFAGIVFTRYNAKVKRRLNEAILIAARSQHGPENILPSIRQDILLAEAQAAQIPVQRYADDSNGASDYSKLTTAILNRI